MNFGGMLACFLVAMECLERAVGASPQLLFQGHAIWLWWLPTVFWAVLAIRFAFAFVGIEIPARPTHQDRGE